MNRHDPHVQLSSNATRLLRSATGRALTFVLSLGLAFGPPSAVAAQSAERVVVLPPGADTVSPATAQLLGEFFRQEVAQDIRFDLMGESAVSCGDSLCAVTAARGVGAERVLWCRVGRQDDEFVLTVTATHVATGSPLGSARVMARSEDELFIAVGPATSDLLDALDSDSPQLRGPADPGSSPGDIPPDLPSISHQPIESAPVGRSLRIDARVDGDLDARVDGDLGGRELYVMFQVGGSDRVRYTRLRPEGREGEGVLYSSEIPSSALTSAGLRYHLRLTDARGDEVSRFPSSGWWSVDPSADPNAPVVRADRPASSKDLSAQGRPAGTVSPPASRGDSHQGSGSTDTGEKSGSKRWWWIGGAAAVAVGGLVALLGGGGDGGPGDPVDPDPATLPDPPEHR